MEGKCLHCQGDLKVRNPMGFCDHLYYPENCDTCKKRDPNISYSTVNFGKREGKK